MEQSELDPKVAIPKFGNEVKITDKDLKDLNAARFQAWMGP